MVYSKSLEQADPYHIKPKNIYIQLMFWFVKTGH